MAGLSTHYQYPLHRVYNGQSSRRPRFPFEFPRKSINGNISLPSLPQRIYILSGRGMYDITNGCLSISRTLYTRPLSLLRTVVRYYRNYSSCRGAGYQRDYPWVCYHCLEKQRRKENGESWEDSFLKRKEDSFLLLYPVEINSEMFGRKFLFESFSAVIFKFIFQVRTKWLINASLYSNLLTVRIDRKFLVAWLTNFTRIQWVPLQNIYTS